MVTRRKLLLLCTILSLCVIACKGKAGHADSSAPANNSGGGSAHIDSLKSIGTGVNGESSNTLDAMDTMKNGHSSVLPKDTTKKKTP